MGGEVLELWRERAERLEREAEARGVEQGIAQGIEQGVAQGIAQGVDDLAAKLRELGIDQRTLDEAISSIKAEHAKS